MILVDTNVLLDLVTDDPRWAEWSQQQLDLASAQDELAINEMVYAELSIGYERMEELDAMLVTAGLANAAIPRPALFLAGKAFQRYRSSGGRKNGVLPDFFIGAHAVVADAALITRDSARYRSHLPGIMVIAPRKKHDSPLRQTIVRDSPAKGRGLLLDRTSGGLMGPGFRRDSGRARFHALGSAIPVAN